jgi:hypothetical protein
MDIYGKSAAAVGGLETSWLNTGVCRVRSSTHLRGSFCLHAPDTSSAVPRFFPQCRDLRHVCAARTAACALAGRLSLSTKGARSHRTVRGLSRLTRGLCSIDKV